MSITDQTCSPCLPACENVFSRVVVSYLNRGGTHVMWELKSSFVDPMPYFFQLQVGQSTNPDADDWEDVGDPVENQFYAVDPERRVYSKYRHQAYRVTLTTPSGIYYSEPTALEGTLDWRDWRIARELLRQELLRMRQFAGQEGFLLKLRTSGEPCPACLDFQTREIRNPNCSVCWGTGWRCGYFFPMSCVWADISPKTYVSKLSPTVGTIKPVVCQARMVNVWMMNTGDVWVSKRTDDRYYVHAVQNLAEVRGVPLVASVELKLAPSSDPIYALNIPDHSLFAGHSPRVV